MSRTAREPGSDPLSLRPLLLLTALGVGLRLALLYLSGRPELQSDEANYVYLGLAWNHFGVYLDQHRYLWPPGYAWFLSLFLERFEHAGLQVARLVQVLASASVGLTVMLFAYRVFDMRAARVAGLIWIVYLPLAVFAHLLWNETLFLAVFLPAVYQVYRVASDPQAVHVDLRLLAAGVLFAAALFLKEAPYYLVPALSLLLVLRTGGVGEGLRRGSLLLLTVAAIVVPWGLRNLEVYGRFVPVGASLGENCYNGLNAEYRNFDLIPLDVARERAGEPPIAQHARAFFVEAPEDSRWKRADATLHTIERNDENVRRGLEYARANPGWLVRSRIKKLADLVTPMSFYTRHLALGHYDSSFLGGSVARKVTGTWALLCPLLVLSLGWLGLTLVLRDRTALLVFGTVIAYVLASSMLVAMSRFRVPMVPLLIVLAAGVLTRGVRGAGPARGALAGVGLAGLAFLWWVDLPEVSRVVGEMVWRKTT